MRQVASGPNRVEQVRAALLDEIASGRLAPGTRIIQESIAQALKVSRQPVQQALLLMRAQGILQDAPGRGLIVTALDPEHAEQMYDLRSVVEGLACARACTRITDKQRRTGQSLIDAGRRAVAGGQVGRMILADIRFHAFLYQLSGNGLIVGTLSTHLTYTQRVMGEVLNIHPSQPSAIWDEHKAILDAIDQGNSHLAEHLGRQHVSQAGLFIAGRLRNAAGNPGP